MLAGLAITAAAILVGAPSRLPDAGAHALAFERQSRIKTAASPNSIALPDIEVPAPDDQTRVTAGALVSPAVAARGGTIVLFVKVRIAPHHWIYALDDSGSVSVPTTLQVSTSAMRPSGEWHAPEPKPRDGSRTLGGDVVFYRPFVIEQRMRPGQLHVPVKVKYQVCNASLCWPATTISLVADVGVANK